MFDELDIKERLTIIKNSNLDDATILDNNYSRLMREVNEEDTQEIIILKNNTQLRIKELTKNA